MTSAITKRAFAVPAGKQPGDFLEAVQQTFKKKLNSRFNEPNLQNADIIARLFNDACMEESQNIGFTAVTSQGAGGGTYKRNRTEKKLFEREPLDFSTRVTRGTQDAPDYNGHDI